MARTGTSDGLANRNERRVRDFPTVARSCWKAPHASPVPVLSLVATEWISAVHSSQPLDSLSPPKPALGNEHQERPLDNQDGQGKRHDRTVRVQPGPVRRDLLRRELVRLRYAGR